MSKVRNSETVFTAAAAAQLTREHRECVFVCALHVIADNSPQTTPTHTWASNAHTQWLEWLLQSILCTQTYTHTRRVHVKEVTHTHTQTEENVCAYGLRGVVVDAVAVVAQLFARVHRRCFFRCAPSPARVRAFDQNHDWRPGGDRLGSSICEALHASPWTERVQCKTPVHASGVGSPCG